MSNDKMENDSVATCSVVGRTFGALDNRPASVNDDGLAGNVI